MTRKAGKGNWRGNKYLLPDKAYKALKWVALIALPALAVFVHVVGPAWTFHALTRS